MAREPSNIVNNNMAKWHGAEVKNSRRTTVIILTSFITLTAFGLFAVHGSFDMKPECVRLLHINRQTARAMPYRLWYERIETSRGKCNGAIAELEAFWEQYNVDGVWWKEILYKIESPRKWNFEKYAFRGFFFLVAKFSLGIWIYFLPVILISFVCGVLFIIFDKDQSRQFFSCILILLDGGIRIYFLWIPEVLLLWVLRWVFGTSLTGHLVFAGYNLAWTLTTMIITIPKQNFHRNVKMVIITSFLIIVMINIVLNGMTLYATFRFIHSDTDVTVTSINFFWMMLVQSEIYPYFWQLLISPYRMCSACINGFENRLIHED